MLKCIDTQILQMKENLLIVSGISIGNVPALTCDQFIKTNQFKRVAYFQTKYIEPSVGYLPQEIEGGALGLPIELYQKGNTLILQFRSHCRFARKKDLAKQVVQEFRKHGVEEIVVISSLPYDIRPDLQISSVENNIYFKSKGVIKGLNLTQNKENRLLSISHLINDEDLQSDLMKNGGLANAFYQEGSNVATLFIFSEEKEDQKLVHYYQKYLTKLLGRKEIN